MLHLRPKFLVSLPCGVRRGYAIVGALVLTWAFERAASAHRLDEYLQAARISVSRDAVRLDLSLAPGAAVAPDILALVDADGNGQISADEMRAYAVRALQAMTLSLDGHPLSLRLVSSDAMTPASLLAGEGFLRVLAEAAVGTPVQIGSHELRFENRLDPGASVYLGNAMLPEDRTIAITGQDHGTNQSTLAIRYDVQAEESIGGLWVWLVGTAAVIGVGFLMAPRFARARKVDRPDGLETSREERSLDEPVAASGDHGERSSHNQRPPD